MTLAERMGGSMKFTPRQAQMVDAMRWESPHRWITYEELCEMMPPNCKPGKVVDGLVEKNAVKQRVVFFSEIGFVKRGHRFKLDPDVAQGIW